MRKMSRRELARMAAALAMARALPLSAQTPTPFDSAQGRPSDYIGPLTGITNGIDDRRFDPVAYTHDRYSAAARRLRFQARTRRQAEEWQKTLRAKLTELIGGFPLERQPLRPPVNTRVSSVTNNLKSGLSMLDRRPVHDHRYRRHWRTLQDRVHQKLPAIGRDEVLLPRKGLHRTADVRGEHRNGRARFRRTTV